MHHYAVETSGPALDLEMLCYMSQAKEWGAPRQHGLRIVTVSLIRLLQAWRGATAPFSVKGAWAMDLQPTISMTTPPFDIMPPLPPPLKG